MAKLGQSPVDNAFFDKGKDTAGNGKYINCVWLQFVDYRKILEQTVIGPQCHSLAGRHLNAALSRYLYFMARGVSHTRSTDYKRTKRIVAGKIEHARRVFE